MTPNITEILNRLEIFVGGLGKAILRELRKELAEQPSPAQLAEADSRAGAAERELATFRDDLARINRVRDKMKDQWGVDHNISFDVVWADALKLKQQAIAQQQQHPDDAAVDRFAAAMKEKLAKAREKGRSGWETCSPDDLSRMLRDHVEKGDPRDVANFAMMLWNLGKGIVAPVRQGWKLVPMRMTQAMIDVTDREEWAWPDLLAAAEAITENEYQELITTPNPVPSPLPDGLIDVLTEAAAVLSEIDPDHAPKNMRWPLADELGGFAMMLKEAQATKGGADQLETAQQKPVSALLPDISPVQQEPDRLTATQRIYLAQAWAMLDDYALDQRLKGNDSFAKGAEASSHEIKMMLSAPQPVQPQREPSEATSTPLPAFSVGSAGRSFEAWVAQGTAASAYLATKPPKHLKVVRHD